MKFSLCPHFNPTRALRVLVILLLASTTSFADQRLTNAITAVDDDSVTDNSVKTVSKDIGSHASPVNLSRFYIEISKSEQRLRLRHGDTIYREYPIAYGRGDRGSKERLGDRKTPEGIYRVVEINESDTFHLFIRLNYPNVSDAFQGFKTKLITRYEFDEIINALRQGRLPLQNTALGGAIGIHGVGRENEKKLTIHANMNWTKGCIALTNAEVSELAELVRVGTEVVIKP